MDHPDRPPVMPALISAVGIVVLWMGLVWVVTTLTDLANPPACTGIGFGCSLDATSATLLSGVVIGLPALLITWVITLTGWAMSRREASAARRRRLVWAGPALLVLAAVVQAVGSTVGALLR